MAPHQFKAMNRVSIKSEMYAWACERAGGSIDDFASRFPKLPEWVSGEAQPTLKQLETFAKADRLQRENITFKMVPYEIKVR